MTVVGFTGTRNGMTSAQIVSLRQRFTMIKLSRFIHGGAIRADTQAHNEAMKFISAKCIEIYPASEDRLDYWRDRYPMSIIHAVSEPLTRNRVIVSVCDILLACPESSDEVLRSGTWSTIRHARRYGRAYTIIYPDGTCT